MPPQVAIGICPALPDTKIPHSEFLIHERGNDMINMVQNAKDQAAALAMAAYQAAVADGTLPQAEVKTAPGGDPQGHRQRRLHHHVCPGGLQGAAAAAP